MPASCRRCGPPPRSATSSRPRWRAAQATRHWRRPRSARRSSARSRATWLQASTYGNLVIVKHNNLFLSAYGHNQALLVKEDQIVRRGQRIAEMGSTDAERVQLHFEIRRQGKPVDPVRLLPPR